MATAAFRSSSGRCASGRGGAQRRSRSLSQYSGRFPPPPPEPDEFPTPRGRFVNKMRGSGFSEISVDDLAEEFFRARAESDEESEPSATRTQRRRSVASYLRDTDSSRQRGRSVSRPPDRRAQPPKGVPDGVSRRRRSMSVARYRRSDSESEMDSLTSSIRNKSRPDGSGIPQRPSSTRAGKNTNLLRSMTQKDFFHSQDCSSSHSSITDDEAQDIRSKIPGNAKIIQTVHVEEKEMMINEHLDIVDGNGIEPKSSEVLQAIAEIRKSYTAKLEQSEKRKQDLLAQLAMEEAHGQELCKIVTELLPSPKKYAAPERQSRSRRGRNDTTRMSKCLTEEAERYFEDFLTNVEDTDISSFDGERSDTSLSIKTQALHNSVAAGTPPSLLKNAAQPSDSDGVLLPWLQWETCMDPSPCKIMPEMIVSSENNLPAAASLPAQEASAGLSNCSQTASSFGSWSPGGNESSSVVSKERSKSKFKPGNRLDSTSYSRTSASSFCMDEYLNLKQSEDLLFERLKQRQRIETGSMILCGQLMT